MRTKNFSRSMFIAPGTFQEIPSSFFFKYCYIDGAITKIMPYPETAHQLIPLIQIGIMKKSVPKSLKKAAGMLSHKKKSLDSYMGKVRSEWNRSS